MKAPVSVLLILTMAAQFFATVMKKLYSDRFSYAKMRHLYNAVTFLAAAVTLLLWGGGQSVSLFTALLAVAFGAVTALQAVMNLKALEIGPFGYTTVVCSLSMLIPTLSGAVFWQEKISGLQIIGIVLMVGCLVLSVDAKSDGKKSSLKWLCYCLIAFLCAGGIGVMQKVHQSSSYKAELNVFLILAFAVSFIYSAVSCFALRKQRPLEEFAEREAPKKRKIFEYKSFWAAMLLLAGICTAVQNKINLYLSGAMDSALFFPLVNGGGVVLAALASVCFFKEKLSKKQWLGIGLGILAVILLCV